MATELAADEPPAVHLRVTEEALATDTADESCAAGEACGLNTVDDLRTAYKPPSFGSASELCAAVRICGIPTVPEFSATEARQKPVSSTPPSPSVNPASFCSFTSCLRPTRIRPGGVDPLVL
ncbi:hypothetical protein VPH35_006521 [Triticum aestivum]